MDASAALAIFAALAQPTRLAGFRLLVASEPEGIPATELARRIGVPQNTMSAHLAALSRARLVSSHRTGRSVVYRADIAVARELALYLLEDCCGGRPEACEPVVRSLSACRATWDAAHA
ncbi:MAG: metalloregulator ArsR/SmtB family transcription factor [Beijerinckiaceae bacterium]